MEKRRRSGASAGGREQAGWQLTVSRLLPVLVLALAPAAGLAQASSALPSAPTPQASSSSTDATGAGSTGAQPAASSAEPGAQLAGGTGGGFPVQVPTESSLFNAYYGSVQAEPVQPRVIALSLDDALKMGIHNNLGLVYSRQAADQQHAMRLQELNILLPNIDVQGMRALRQFNLEAEGFRPSVLASFAGLTGGGGGSGSFPLVVKVNTVQAQANLSQYLFDWAGYDLVKALGHLVKSTDLTAINSRGLVVENAGVAYLRVVAAQSQVGYDQALLKTDEGVVYQTHQEHLAGVVANLDDLRAQVQYQTEQQTLIGDENTLAKAKIALNRTIGLAPEQEIAVTAARPFAELELMTPETAVAEALRQRQDYASAVEELKAAESERKAATHERYPTLTFNGDYGVIGVVGGNYRGVFTATGTLNIPVFQEAKFRSDRDLAEFQKDNARAQVKNLREQIAQQVRGNLIDLQAAEATVTVARSNAQMSQVALDEATERFRAGVEDNLPAIDAESTLAQAQVQVVNAEFELNQAKLSLAQDLGMIDIGFHPEWQGGRPAGVESDQVAMGRFGQ